MEGLDELGVELAEETPRALRGEDPVASPSDWIFIALAAAFRSRAAIRCRARDPRERDRKIGEFSMGRFGRTRDTRGSRGRSGGKGAESRKKAHLGSRRPKSPCTGRFASFACSSRKESQCRT